MWFDRTPLRTLISEFLAVTRENNGLLRELVRAVTLQDPRTPFTPHRPREGSDSSRKIRTEKDVFQVDAETRAEIVNRRQEQIIAPHRTPDALKQPEG